ncbi:MAG TPA: hypothetical protein DDZ51_19205 [Planctomycetaceae bacterium]|nr:hypothetical protein [Planctomycetaceae bacterium]
MPPHPATLPNSHLGSMLEWRSCFKLEPSVMPSANREASVDFSYTQETTSLSSQRFRLGTFFGIGLYVHWTFVLLVAYVTYVTWASGASPVMVVFTIVQLLAVFACVTLHEYGHALAARRYDVETHDITLLPIGGVARLKRIPRIPIQEFVIAVAGPAVNVVIAAILLIFIFATGQGWLFEMLYEVMSGTIAPEELESSRQAFDQVFETPTLIGFALSIFTINVILVLFNMIPAFPMDGGRVLRSLLAMIVPYVWATRWAQRIGVVCAILMAAAALTSDPPRIVMLLIAGFIVFAGLAEVRQVEVREMVDGLTVGDVMTENVPVVRADMTAGQLSHWWKSHPNQSAAVIGINGMLLGQLRLRDLISHLQQNAAHLPNASSPTPDNSSPYRAFEEQPPQWDITAIDLADPNADTLEADEGLEGLMASGKQTQREFAVTDHSGRLIGWINLDNIREHAALAKLRTLQNKKQQPTWSIDHHA